MAKKRKDVDQQPKEPSFGDVDKKTHKTYLPVRCASCGSRWGAWLSNSPTKENLDCPFCTNDNVSIIYDYQNEKQED
jgi:hypothetical protein